MEKNNNTIIYLFTSQMAACKKINLTCLGCCVSRFCGWLLLWLTKSLNLNLTIKLNMRFKLFHEDKR